MQATKKEKRLRRARRTRARIHKQRDTRLTVYRSNMHVYAQVIDSSGVVVATASTLEKGFRQLGITSNIEAARRIGEAIAKRCLDKGIKAIAFDRSGYKYHGRVEALAAAAREAGLEF